MKIEVIENVLAFIALCLAQVLVFNHINLLGCATPLLYIYFILKFRSGFPQWAILLWSFMLGLCIDMFSNTPGVATSSCTIMGLLQPYLLKLFIPRDNIDDQKPAMNDFGAVKNFWFTFLGVLIYNILFFTTETFNFFNWQQWLMNIGGSTLLTTLIIVVIEAFRRH